MTTEELQAENEALRGLLAAIRVLADPAKPADVDDLQVHYLECVRRLDIVAVYADGEIDDVIFPENRVNILRDRAKAVREHAARPLRYKAEIPQAVSS